MADKSQIEKEASINALMARERPERELDGNEEQWWDTEEKIQQFVIAFYREHQRYPTYTAIAKGVGIDKNTVTAHLNGGDEVDELYRKRLKTLARLYSTKTMTALYNAAIKGNHNAAGMIINYGLGADDARSMGSGEKTEIVITVEQAESIEDKIAKFQRSKDRDADLDIVEGEVINAHSNTKK